MNNLITPPTPPSAGTTPPIPSPPGQSGSKGFDVIDLKQYFHIIVKRIWLVALCFVVSLAVMVVVMIRQVPVYRCSAILLLSEGLPVPMRLRQTEMEPLRGADYLTTQQRIIQSSLLIQRARERVGRPAEEVGKLLKKISVELVYKTSMLRITVESLDPVFGSEYANALAEEYIEFKSEERINTSQATVISLTQQANRLREELKKAEDRVVAYEKENKVIAIEDRGNIAANFLSKLSAEAAGYKTQRMLLEAEQPLLNDAPDDIVLTTLSSPIRGGGYYGSSSMVSLGGATNALPAGPRGPEALIEYGTVSQPGWVELRRKKSRLESQLSELRVRFRDAHPKVQKTLNELRRVERELDVELQFALRQYYAKLESLALKEKAAKQVERDWEDDALEVARKSHEYRNLKRSVNRLQNLYDLVFNRLKEVDVSIGIEPESVSIMERAHPAGAPITPRKLQSIFLAALIGLGIGLGLVFALEFIDDSLRYPEEVTSGLGLAFLGVIPAASWDTDDLSTHILSNFDQKSGLAEAYRNVRSALLFSGIDDRMRSLVITSSIPKEGKTTTSLNLSVSLSQTGARVLLVDGDMRRGELHKFFGLEAGRGLSDMLVGQAKPESVIQRTGLPNLDLIATGPFPPNPAELFLRPELMSFQDYARQAYDWVLFDCPPVMAVSEAAILSSLMGGVIFVVWAGQTSKKLAQLSVRNLRERGANIVGCVLNNLEFGRVGYYYYSTYYGYYDYDYRYGGREPEKK